MSIPTRTSPDASRRLLVQASISLPVLGVFGCGAFAADTTPPPIPLYFTAAERAFVAAAIEQLIPDGDDGLGARSAGVVFFIDRQLAGPFGRADTWYMRAPFEHGTKQQGYQSKLTPAGLYRTAIRDVDAHCKRAYGGKTFAELADAEQNKLLHSLEKGELKLAEADAKDFFAMLWQNTQEGFLADPMYGGNRNFAGWRLIGFPGPRYNYVNEITAYGKRYTLPPVGLLGRNGFLIEGAD
jgi:gluconate 2-dehydrogenase gamma chain